MAKNLTAPNDGIGSAGNTAGFAGIETQTTKDSPDRHAESTTQNYIPAAAGSGALTTPGVSSTQTDGLDEGV
jgi:hypothetical protein